MSQGFPAENPAGQPFPGWAPTFTAALERLTIAVRRPAAGQYAGDVRSLARGHALEFADYRAYTPGDDPKLVDWRAYTRLGRLYLKQYEEERSRTVTLLVDASASMDWGDGGSHKGLYARRLAAALLWIGACHRERVRVFLLRDGRAEQLPPVSSRSGALALYRELGQARESGKTALAEAVRLPAAPSSRGPLVLLSDLLDRSWPEALTELASVGEVAVIQLLAPQEWEPSLGEEVELVDAETGELRPTRLGPVELSTYRARLDAFLADVRAKSGRYGLAHVALSTGLPFQEVVLRRLPSAGVLSG